MVRGKKHYRGAEASQWESQSSGRPDGQKEVRGSIDRVGKEK